MRDYHSVEAGFYTSFKGKSGREASPRFTDGLVELLMTYDRAALVSGMRPIVTISQLSGGGSGDLGQEDAVFKLYQEECSGGNVGHYVVTLDSANGWVQTHSIILSAGVRGPEPPTSAITVVREKYGAKLMDFLTENCTGNAENVANDDVTWYRSFKKVISSMPELRLPFERR